MHRTTLRNCSQRSDMHHTCTVHCWEIVLKVYYLCTIHAPYMHRTTISNWKYILSTNYLLNSVYGACMVHCTVHFDNLRLLCCIKYYPFYTNWLFVFYFPVRSSSMSFFKSLKNIFLLHKVENTTLFSKPFLYTLSELDFTQGM